MFELTKRFTIEASHRLPDHDGKCRNLHGHSWGIEVTVCGERLQDHGPQRGMVGDFGRLKAVVAPVLEGLDHHDLSDLLPDPPTSEHLAYWLFNVLREPLAKVELKLHEVAVLETATSRCVYREA